MSTTYRRAERQVLRDYALQVATDPNSTPEDRAAAAQRLLDDDGREVDMKRLTTPELLAFRDAMLTVRRCVAKARGEAVDVREPSQPNPYLVELLGTPQRPEPADLVAQDARTVRTSIASAFGAAEPAAPVPYTLAQLGLAR